MSQNIGHSSSKMKMAQVYRVFSNYCGAYFQVLCGIQRDGNMQNVA